MQQNKRLFRGKFYSINIYFIEYKFPRRDGFVNGSLKKNEFLFILLLNIDVKKSFFLNLFKIIKYNEINVFKIVTNHF